jgi:HSP20 family protein
MALLKKSEWPSLIGGPYLSDFVDNENFFDSDLLRRQFAPAVNVRETEKHFEIEVAAPGLNKKDFNITVENRVLTISSDKEEQKEEKDGNYTRKEFSYHSFTRSFTLPEGVKEEDVKATYSDGVLRLNVAKNITADPKVAKAIVVN